MRVRCLLLLALGLSLVSFGRSIWFLHKVRESKVDEFPELTRRSHALHLNYRIWCYQDGKCYGVAWSDKYSFIDANVPPGVAEWGTSGVGKQEVATSLVVLLSGPPNLPPSAGAKAYDSGIR